MTRLFLAAGVASLAIAAPAYADKGGHGGGEGKGGQAVSVERSQGGGGGGDQRGRGFERRGGGDGGGFAVQRVERRHGGGGFAVPRMERSQRFAAFDRGGHGAERGKAHGERVNRVERVQSHGNFERGNFERGKVRAAERRQFRENRVVGRDMRENRVVRVENRFDRPEQIRNERMIGVRESGSFPGRFADARGAGLIDGCPPGLWMKNNGCLPPGQAKKILGTPLASAAPIAGLSPLPLAMQGFYPDTPDNYYRYGDGYLYGVDRNTNLVNSLLPLIGGGYVPGSYLPTSYMNSYVPDYYGLNSFYPDYGNSCNRYANGVIYQVDCFTGMVENVIPMYAGGYGVGQMLPSAYGYYNVPSQYRNLYYNTPDQNYWYAPGAIYQYDPGSSMITSVAALLSPGFGIGQQLPMGYSAYNVPYGYRQTYYDTPTAWYRYNNGNIYQVDPMTQLVTAIVASVLT